jgi:hypothetical protein
VQRNSSPRRPNHQSYEVHRRQVWTHVLLPVFLGALLLVGAVILIAEATFRGQGDAARWGAISTIWLVIPVMAMGAFVLAVLCGLIYVLAKITGFIPTYSYQAQRITHRVQAGIKRGTEMMQSPGLAVREVGAFLKNRLQRARERM